MTEDYLIDYRLDVPKSEFVREGIFRDINTERRRQIDKFGDQTNNEDGIWTAILGEEFGESAKEVLEGGAQNGKLYKELTEVAAVAVAWMEALIKRGEG